MPPRPGQYTRETQLADRDRWRVLWVETALRNGFPVHPDDYERARKILGYEPTRAACYAWLDTYGGSRWEKTNELPQTPSEAI